jgi:hypothetical protein
MLQQFTPIIRGSCLPQKLLKQYLCCGYTYIYVYGLQSVQCGQLSRDTIASLKELATLDELGH